MADTDIITIEYRIQSSGVPMDTSLEDRVKAFVARELGVRSKKVTLNTRIVEDIGCDGDDAGELFEAFAKGFGVDLTGMEWGKYLRPEGFGCSLWFIFDWFAGITKKPGVLRIMEPVTVQDLIKAAKAKEWVKPPGADMRFPNASNKS